MIQTLVDDLYSVLKSKNWMTSPIADQFASSLSKRLQVQFTEATEKPTLRLSRMGPQCPCALWHSIHHPELAESLPPWAINKYSFGHMVEAWAITLAKASGKHEVTGEQDEVVVDGISGHRDCVIDGCIVDVKSASSMGWIKFKDGSIKEADSFGYLDQLDGYTVGSLDDPLVTVKDRAYILAIDKQLGKICLYEHYIRANSIKHRIVQYKEIVGRSSVPLCTCEVQSDGKSGNIKLGTRASYSPFKHCCFPRLRTFLYSDGPRYLVHVARKPEVPEVDRHGKIIWN